MKTFQCHCVKLHNRRVCVYTHSGGLVTVSIRRLIGWKDIKTTQFQLSHEAARALLLCMTHAVPNHDLTDMQLITITYK